MSSIEDEMNLELFHYGTPRHSGRYPWGSGENPFQRSGDFLARVDELKKTGKTETEIAKEIGVSTTQLRVQLSLAKEERRSDLIATAKSLQKDGLNNVQIADRMGLKGESTVRSLLNADSEARMKIADKTANNLKKLVDEKGMIDVGVGVERELGISKEKMNAALEILKFEGYEVYGGRVPQATNKGKYTTIKVLCPPGTEHKEIYNFDKINSVRDYISRDGGDTFEPAFVYPNSLDSKRLAIRYAEEGGVDKDGVVEIRRGVRDLSLGESNYAQVRIMVDGTHYIKGMAVYSDDLPDGVDILFNTNKTREKCPEKLDVLKEIKKDPENPFGSAIKEHGGQSYFKDEDGNDPHDREHLSLINKRADEGDWKDWSDHLPSQFLAKQPLQLINKQLKLAEEDKEAEFKEICELTNPTVKKNLLESFANDCDSAAVHLQAASLPGQKYQVILPLTSIKDTEVYAPNYKDGSKVALIRYPHGGLFEIPILTVNNRLEEGKKVIGINPADAVGINKAVADRLSGADFDGDTVTVIPLSDKVNVKNTPPLKQLEGFDTKLSYGPDEVKTDENGEKHYFRGGIEYKVMSKSSTQTQMGIISNLITDMTLQGADQDELARAVKHSMVVIDANKHHLNYKESEKVNGIAQLHHKYQHQVEPDGREHEGAATLLSKAKSKMVIPERKEGAFYLNNSKTRVEQVDPDSDVYLDPKTGEVYDKSQVRTLYIDPDTGEKLYRNTNRTYTKVKYIDDKTGKKKEANAITKDGKLYYKVDGTYIPVTNEKIEVSLATQNSTKMAEAKDARTLSLGTPQEEAYAKYANKLKALANSARKEYISTKDIPYSPSAKQAYSQEVESLEYKYDIAQRNAPKERLAQTIAASRMKEWMSENPLATSEEEKKQSQKELSKARQKIGAKREPVDISDKEWEAIQAGAISSSKLKGIISSADSKRLKELATPRTKNTLSEFKINRIKSMASLGYSNYEIADLLGISSSSVSDYLTGKK